MLWERALLATRQQVGSKAASYINSVGASLARDRSCRTQLPAVPALAERTVNFDTTFSAFPVRDRRLVLEWPQQFTRPLLFSCVEYEQLRTNLDERNLTHYR